MIMSTTALALASACAGSSSLTGLMLSLRYCKLSCRLPGSAMAGQRRMVGPLLLPLLLLLLLLELGLELELALVLALKVELELELLPPLLLELELELELVAGVEVVREGDTVRMRYSGQRATTVASRGHTDSQRPRFTVTRDPMAVLKDTTAR